MYLSCMCRWQKRPFFIFAVIRSLPILSKWMVLSARRTIQKCLPIHRWVQELSRLAWSTDNVHAYPREKYCQHPWSFSNYILDKLAWFSKTTKQSQASGLAELSKLLAVTNLMQMICFPSCFLADWSGNGHLMSFLQRQHFKPKMFLKVLTLYSQL